MKMSEKHALRRAFLYATFAYERLRVGIRERLFRFGVYLLCAVGPGLSVTERLGGVCFLYAVGLELSLYSCYNIYCLWKLESSANLNKKETAYAERIQ